jgi:NADH-quinone oxidoreductase subunit N
VILLLSLAGIHYSGFMSKFLHVACYLEVGNLWLAVFAVIMAAVSVYYYFRLIQRMYFKTSDDATAVPSVPFNSGLQVRL